MNEIPFFKFFFVLTCLIFTSCSVYKEDFDCPPSKGVPCTSVTDLEAMIIETEQGPDIFTGQEPQASTSFCKKEIFCNDPTHKSPRKKAILNKIWIKPHTTDSGNFVQGHYVYLIQSEKCANDFKKTMSQE